MEAAAIVAAESGASCFACGLVGALVVRETDAARVVVPRIALREGHVLVVAKAHVERFVDTPDATLDEMFHLARDAARDLEVHLKPPRVFVASLGAQQADLGVTTPHLHIHVVPLLHRDERPRDVLTWSNGVLLMSPEAQLHIMEKLFRTR